MCKLVMLLTLLAARRGAQGVSKPKLRLENTVSKSARG